MSDEETDWRSGETRGGTTTSRSHSEISVPVPAFTILSHPDRRRVGERAVLPHLALGHPANVSRLEPVFRHPRSASNDEALPLAERSISRRPIRFLAVAETRQITLDVGDTPTAVTLAGERLKGSRTLSSDDIARGVVLLLGRKIVLLLHQALYPPAGDPPRFGLVGESDAILALRQEIVRLASSDAPVLLRGESGTGKELVARGLHLGGPRRERPFVAVNMATLTPSLAAAELFGAARGAFTGADRKKTGLFQSAQHGTLFLDEIGETPVEVQAMLLRALENREILPVGSVEPVAVDVRVVAATDARLEQAMSEGTFRAPLYHRLAGHTVRLPPLRQRLEDVGRLLHFFLDQEAAQASAEPKAPSAEVVARLARHHWPGNVRELRNIARRLALGPISKEQLDELLTPLPDKDSTASPPTVHPAPNAPTDAPPARPTSRRKRRDPSDVGEDELLAALEAHDYRMRETAEALGLSRIGFYRRLDESPNVKKAADLARPEIDRALAEADGNVETAAKILQVSLRGLKRRITALGRS